MILYISVPRKLGGYMSLKDYSWRSGWIVWERLWRFPTVCGRTKTNILCTDDLPGLQRVDPPSCKAVMQHAITPACLAPFGGKNCTIWWQNWSLDCVATLPVMRLSFERTLWFHCGKIKILTMSYMALVSSGQRWRWRTHLYEELYLQYFSCSDISHLSTTEPILKKVTRLNHLTHVIFNDIMTHIIWWWAVDEVVWMKILDG